VEDGVICSCRTPRNAESLYRSSCETLCYTVRLYLVAFCLCRLYAWLFLPPSYRLRWFPFYAFFHLWFLCLLRLVLLACCVSPSVLCTCLLSCSAPVLTTLRCTALPVIACTALPTCLCLHTTTGYMLYTMPRSVLFSGLVAFCNTGVRRFFLRPGHCRTTCSAATLCSSPYCLLRRSHITASAFIPYALPYGSSAAVLPRVPHTYTFSSCAFWFMLTHSHVC